MEKGFNFYSVYITHWTARKINVTKFVNKEVGLLIVTDVAVSLVHMITPQLHFIRLEASIYLFWIMLLTTTFQLPQNCLYIELVCS